MSAALDAAWAALEAHRARVMPIRLREAFASDPDRFARLSLCLDDLLIDFSKNLILPETLELLLALARAAEVEAWRERMWAGERINTTENRPVLHVALRHPGPEPITVDGRDVVPEVRAVLERMRAFEGELRSGRWCGATGARITDVVNLGIGGSDLGPRMVCTALEAYAPGDLAVHFVSNVDGSHLARTLRRLDPARTLFVVASKTFTTQETMQNAASARAWLVAALGEAAVARHFVAVSTNEAAVRAFGIDPERMFGFWEWVGGRFSLWSAIGLPIVLALGFARFSELLAGAHAMDRHFRTAPFERNAPVLLALLGIWYRDLLGCATRAVVPYDQGLIWLPAYLQQLEMESNGKRVRRDGRPMARPTAPVVWGAPGTDGQHAFFQLLHQGTEIVPLDLLVAALPSHDLPGHHEKLLANVLAQGEALAFGRTEAEVRAALSARGAGGPELDALVPHRVFPGDRPSTAILYRRLDPFTLGRLLALYEHQVFVEGVIWGIDSFDQWGVELGKELAGAILPDLDPARKPAPRDGSTAGQLAHLRRLRADAAP